jgi:tetratricopeptide (TPR) repeat protein
MGKLTQGSVALNESDELRDYIYESEKSLVRIEPESARHLMISANEAHRVYRTLEADGVDVRAEAARLNGVDERIRREARPIVKALGGREALVALRQQVAPVAPELFWMLDQELDQRKQALIKRLVYTGIGLVVFLIVAAITKPIWLPPNPANDAEVAATRALADNNLPGALAAIQDGLKITPTNSELLIWQGYFYDKQGDAAASAQSYDQAKAQFPSEVDFLVNRALVLVRFGEYDKVVDDTNKAIALNPNSAEAYYLRASGWEGTGDRVKAMADLNTCADLANAQGNDALYATAKVRLGNLMQAQ